MQAPYEFYSKDMDLIADGLILGLTQVACLKINQWVIEDAWLGQNVDTYDQSGNKNGNMVISDYHQHIAHAHMHLDKHANNAPNLIIRDNQTVIARCVARFLQRLDAIKEADGSSVLDNTLVVWTTQMGDQSSHRSGLLPFVLAGGLGEKMGTFKMGRFLDVAPGGITENPSILAGDCAVTHHRLMNSIQKTFGIDQDLFGENIDPARCMGHLPRALG